MNASYSEFFNIKHSYAFNFDQLKNYDIWFVDFGLHNLIYWDPGNNNIDLSGM
jgi:hypothetical protein